MTRLIHALWPLAAAIGLLLVFALSGCQTDPTPAPLIQTVTKSVLLTPSNDLLADCEVKATPPDAALYTAGSDRDRVQLLRPYVTALQQDLHDCADIRPLLRDWYAKQQALVDAANAKTP